MLKDYVFFNFELVVFFFILFGFFVVRVEIFYFFKFDGVGDFVVQFLDKLRIDLNLWNEGIVRNGYF